MLVTDEQGALAGILTRGDLVRALEIDSLGAMSALAAGSSPVHVTYPDESLSQALARMLDHHCGRLPVVAWENPRRILGYLGRASILEARRRRHLEERRVAPGWISAGQGSGSP